MPRYESPYDPAQMPTGQEHIVYEKKGNVAYVRINRPEVMNALHSYAYAEMRAAWRDIGMDPNIYCGIVTGTGKAFCAGRDVKFLAKYQAEGKRTPHEDPTNPMFFWGGGGQPSDANLHKPLICALNGFAVGVGLSLALQCQLRVMADDAWIGDTHTLVGRLGSPQKMLQSLPPAIAAYLTLCNGRLTAQECLQYAIVNRVVPQDKVIEEAEKLAAMICMGSPLATQAAVKLYRMAQSQHEALDSYAKHLDKETAESEDGAEGPRAFREKRKPVWKLR
ncbi:enoyl-CoA hydratase-related protein [Bosea sp. BK604]|uniref:enoyl-CoA hydratase/isomerase family protein n=1 Tax=Bosea sp. BK604 TaxID=2512180 RepID=UPI00104B1F2B|nr:enoyl-CoA hydratase-related protein [Bosea sp. BK604]TCR62532.1 enoyl-CoA hydratase/E-phenylitaconyl-CoA hydratase/crotonobetainyl-CoA hydratase [Bosea sp. BK604]